MASRCFCRFRYYGSLASVRRGTAASSLTGEAVASTGTQRGPPSWNPQHGRTFGRNPTDLPYEKHPHDLDQTYGRLEFNAEDTYGASSARASTASGPTSSWSAFRRPWPSRGDLYVTYHDLEEALHRRGFSLYKLVLGTAAATFVVVAVFWNRIKNWGAQESADVASKTLEDSELQKSASELAKQVAGALMADENTSAAFRSLLQQVLVDPESAKVAHEFVGATLESLMTDEKLKNEFQQYVGDVLLSDYVMEQATKLAIWVIKQPAVVDVVRLRSHVGAWDWIWNLTEIHV